MKKFLKLTLVLTLLLLLSCPSEDDCIKTIIVQPEFSITEPYGSTYYPEQTQEVPCDFPEPTVVEPIGEGNVLKNFSYEVINFTYTADTGNGTYRLQFEIKLNNENDFIVRGNPILTIDNDGLEFSRSYSTEAISPCNEIQANSSCILIYDKEAPIDLNIGPPSSKFELVSIKYVL